MRDRDRRILTLALPIIGGMVSQNVLNLVDTAMVGSLGDAALAAVGTGGFANFLAIAFVTGLATGVQAMASRRKGEGRDDETAVPLNGALVLAALVSIPITLVLWFVVPVLFPLLNPDPEVVAGGVPYLRARILAMVAVGMNFSFRGYWNAVDLSRLYLRTLLVMHACNIFLNWVLIFGHLGMPELGAHGAGVASAIATYVGTAYYFGLGRRHAEHAGFLRGLPSRETFATIIRLALPNGLQQLSFAAGFTVLFWIIAQSGMAAGRDPTSEVAAANVVINVTLVALLPGLGLGIASASLVGQALGRRDPEDARRWAWDVVRVAAVVMTLLGLPMLLLPDLILSAFLHDPATLALARGPLRLVGAMIVVDSVGMVLGNSLMGAGATRTVMAVSVATQWGFFLPVAYVVGVVLGHGLMGVWLMQVTYRAAAAVVMAVLWRRGKWASIDV
jgi:multidrug resistance protein, MATE family